MKIKSILTLGAAAALSVLSVTAFGDQIGKRATGWVGAFNTDYIYTGQRGVTGLCHVTINQPMSHTWAQFRAMGYTNPVDFVSAIYFKYRYRKGDETIDMLPGDTARYSDRWRTELMVPIGPETFATCREIPIPDTECDLEYWYFGTSKAPYYEYVDYTGLNLPVSAADYTEQHLSVTGRLSICSYDKLPSRGKDYFTRIRKGKSSSLTVKQRIK